MATLSGMLEEDTVGLCGSRYGCAVGKEAHRWGKTRGKVGFNGCKVEIERPRARAGGELALPSWTAAQSEDFLGKWAMNLMLINVSTRRFGRAVRLPEGDVPAPEGVGLSKSAVSRRFVALSAECPDGFALDGRWHDGSCQGLPPVEGTQATANPAGGSTGPPGQARHHTNP